MKKSLTTISYNKKARDKVYEQLSDLIGNEVNINSLCVDDLREKEKIHDDLILITAKAIKNHVLPFIDKSCKYIVASRNLDTKNLRLLFDIPPGSEVLVVNNLLVNTIEVIRELETIGISHLKYYPYEPGNFKNKHYDYAITIGEPELVPQNVSRVIDLGDRPISVMTISKILTLLDIDNSFDFLISSTYISDLVKLSMQLTNKVKQNQLLQLQLEKIISNFDDGVIVTDEKDNILIHNKVVEEMLNINSSLIGKNIRNIFFINGEENNHEFVYINHKTIYLSVTDIFISDNYKTKLIILRDVSKIQDIHNEFKKQEKLSKFKSKYTFSQIIYKSEIMHNLINKARKIAKTDSTVLILGESGTGKEMLAQSIHNESKRSRYPFVAINCATIPETLLESELFGYEEGAFTGAKKGGKKGLFELADRGTIFLDEIGDAPHSIQIKLLRVLQEKEIMRVAGEKIIPVDVRIIAATNKNLIEMVAKGKFRKDLYYRLNILPILVPPLRERKEDIEALLNFFLARFNISEKTRNLLMDYPIKKLIMDYDWPGNIRELENFAEYINVISEVSTDLYNDIINFFSSKNYIQTRQDTGYVDPLNLKNPEIKKQAILILKILHKAKNEGIIIGRTRIKRILEENGIKLSEQQIKTRIEFLKKNNFILSLTGKGSVITLKGEKFLQLYSSS
ncbi:MAG TPA: sigma 54-interacting transcriptional regulator [Thermoanaerobacterales bacterium]|nr:sigma 54-interacting transcriptional regulator [Thermoanaerobacterales bacterium]